MVPVLATRLAGSSDLYQDDGRAPFHSINFVTSHDGFTLADLVSYAQKHNQANGEYGADGDDHNFSANHGCEGATDDPVIGALRARQVYNFATLLVLAHGVPMLLAGDEMARTQGGNNNAWCQDNATSWLDWTRLAANRELFDFFRNLIAFRKRYSLLRPRHFEGEESGERRLTWHGSRLHHPDWSADSHALGMHLQGAPEEAEVYLIASAALDDADFDLPGPDPQRPWRRFVDTTLADGRASCPPGEEAPLPGQTHYRVRGRSVVVLVR
jgi:glycogen operon protein